MLIHVDTQFVVVRIIFRFSKALPFLCVSPVGGGTCDCTPMLKSVLVISLFSYDIKNIFFPLSEVPFIG